MNLRHLPPFTRAKDKDGNPIVRISSVKGAIAYGLANHKATMFATVDAEDLDRLLADGISLHWFLNARAADDRKHSYVRVHVPGYGNRQVAQLIAKAPKGTGITYRDGNPLNLRKSNLVIGKGRSKGDCRFSGEFAETTATTVAVTVAATAPIAAAVVA